MFKSTISLLWVSFFLVLTIESLAQTKKPGAVNNVLTADSLASGNRKDVFNSFFQLAITNLTGPNKFLGFTSNPYAIMLRADPTLAVDTNYSRLRPWRKLNFNFSLSLDSAYHFHGFSSGVKYALIDNRDTTTSKWLLRATMIADSSLGKFHYALSRYRISRFLLPDQRINSLFTSDVFRFEEYDPSFRKMVLDMAENEKLLKIGSLLNEQPATIPANISDPDLVAERDRLAKALDDQLKGSDPVVLAALTDSIKQAARAFSQNISDLFNNQTKAFGSYDPAFQAVAKQIAAENQLDNIIHFLSDQKTIVFADEHKAFDSLKSVLQNQSLWTVGVSDTTYQDQFFFSNIVASSEYLKGFINPASRTNLEADIKLSMNWVDDSLVKSRNLQRSFVRFEPGINWVIKQRNTRQSMLEFSFNLLYNHFFSGWYGYENQDQLNFGGTIRLRVSNNFWIPLQFVYDRKTGNVLGFLNITTNFSGLSGLFKTARNQ